MMVMRDFLKSYTSFYRDQLVLNFFKKRGKSISIPHTVYCLNRLLNSGRQSDSKETDVKVLDIGCADGYYLRLIDKLLDSLKPGVGLDLIGLDNDEDVLELARKVNGSSAEFVNKDLRYEVLEDLDKSFDLVVSINTFHEVFTSFLGVNDEYPEKKIKYAKEKIAKIFEQIYSIMNEGGSFIFYDGLDVPLEVAEKEIVFNLKTSFLKENFERFMREYAVWDLNYDKIKAFEYKMSYRDFIRFISTFKYLNTKLWPFESNEVYHYLSKDEFLEILEELGFKVEVFVSVSNDLGLWKENVEILSEDLDFPDKACLIVASKGDVDYGYGYFD